MTVTWPLIDSKDNTDFTKLEMQHFDSTNQNLIRKVEMSLDSDTDIHIYEKKNQGYGKKTNSFLCLKKNMEITFNET